MRTVMGYLAIGLAAFLAGCYSPSGEQLESDFKTLQARCETLSRQNEALKANVETLRAENASLERQRYGVRTENEALKRQLDTERTAAAQKMDKLVKELAAAKGGAAAEATATNTLAAPVGTAAPGTTAAPVRDEQAIKEAERSVAELQSAITPIQARVNQAKSKIMSIIRGTVDVPMIPPAGGFVRDGQIYTLRCTEPPSRWIITGSHTDAYGNVIQERSQIYHTHRDSCYQPIGPAVKVGDFRTVLERNKAIQAAKDANLPLEQELKSLQDELAKAKANLAKLRASQSNM